MKHKVFFVLERCDCVKLYLECNVSTKDDDAVRSFIYKSMTLHALCSAIFLDSFEICESRLE